MSSDRHLGHLFLEYVRSRPNAICQINAATDESETNASVLSRTIRLARAFRAFGLKPGDVLAVGGRNHLDLCIPFYAALVNGLPLFGIDPAYKFDEIKHLLKLSCPKLAFCDLDHRPYYEQAIKELELDTKILTIGYEDCDMNKFLVEYPSEETDESFEPTPIDVDQNLVWLISTSGTMGRNKIAAFSHRVWLDNVRSKNIMKANSEINRPAFNQSPIHWISGISNLLMMPLQSQCIVHSPLPLTTDHVIDIINKYKPVFTMFSPSTLAYILKDEKYCDLTCFDHIILGGGKVYPNLLIDAKKRTRKDAIVVEMHGQTETIGPVLFPHAGTPMGSVGRPGLKGRVKLVDPDTEQEILEPNKTGELWYLGPRFAGYYNDPIATANALSEDGWFKTGDLMYRNEDNEYFFVERLKLLIKYQNYQIIPTEIEDVIRSHPGVYDVAVTCIPHVEDGELPVACVVRKPGAVVNAQELKDMVASQLSENKEIRGGVVFLDELPMTSSRKISIAKLKEIAQTAQRE